MNTNAADTQIVTAEMRHIEDCLDALLGSDIEKRYFSDRQYTRNLLQTGIDKNELFVGIGPHQAVVGFYWASAGGMFCRFSYLRLLAINPAFRNRGIGKKLLGHFEENGFARAAKVFLAVSDFNVDAQRFYEHTGYRQVGIIPDLYKPGIAEILLMKSSSKK
jgi:ribosomal protein S18 acetylase RimI-like enzyme